MKNWSFSSKIASSSSGLLYGPAVRKQDEGRYVDTRETYMGGDRSENEIKNVMRDPRLNYKMLP